MPIFFDKTGTLTKSELRLDKYEKIIPFDDSLFSVLKHVQKELKSPFFYAFCDFADLDRDQIGLIQNIHYCTGRGISFDFKEQKYSLMKSSSDDHLTSTSELYLQDKLIGRILFEQELRSSALSMVDKLKSLNHSLHILSGDNSNAVGRIAVALGIKNIFFGKNPKDKESIVSRERAIFAGEGLNDSFALRACSISFASYGASSPIQQISSLSVLKDDLNLIPITLKVMRFFKIMLNLNYILGLSYNLVLIPLALLGYMSPFISAITMLASSVMLIVLNIYSTKLALARYQNSMSAEHSSPNIKA